MGVLGGRNPLLLGFLRQPPHDINTWDPEEDAQWREMLSAGNDGIISSAAIIQGLLSGGATGREAVIGVLATIIIGMVGSGATQFNEAASQRAAELRIVEEEKASLEASPEEEFAELVALYEAKGLSAHLAKEVAEELTEKDALKAQLDEEYDLSEVHPARWPWLQGLLAAGVFLLGSLLPLLFLLLLPWNVRGEVTVTSVMIALAISGWLGHLVDHTTAWKSMLRTMAVGALILGISTVAGSLVTF